MAEQTQTPSPVHRFYADHPLPAHAPKSVRLLDLSPLPPRGAEQSQVVNAATPDEGDPPLTGRVRIVNLDEWPTFTVLSYVWGQKAVPSHTITLFTGGNGDGDGDGDGGSDQAVSTHPESAETAATTTRTSSSVVMEITASCYGALQKIRRKFGAVSIWVDAICINQDDVAEKEVQIPLMHEIYSWAETTYVWLGDGTPQTDAAMDHMHRCGVIMPRLPVKLLAAADEERRQHEWEQFTAGCKEDFHRRLDIVLHPKKTAATADDIGALLGRGWIFRAWTFQELILSANPVILCGDRVLNWDRLAGALCCGIGLVFDWFSLRGYRELVLLISCMVVKLWRSEEDHPHATTLRRWNALVDLWMHFPRSSHWNGRPMRNLLSSTAASRSEGPEGREEERDVEATASSSSADRSSSFVDAMNRLGLIPMIQRRAMGWNIYQWATNLGFVLAVMVVICSIIIPIVRSQVKDTDPDADFFWKFGFGFSVPFSFLMGLSLVRIFRLYSSFVIMGFHDGYYAQSSWSNRWGTGHSEWLAQTLAGLHDALRHRDCYLPHDRAFALEGVFAAMSAADAVAMAADKPDYNEPCGPTYTRLMERLIRWQPATLSMIIDAGGRMAMPGTPSWVPAWGRSPSKWLSFRYQADQPAPQTPFRRAYSGSHSSYWAQELHEPLPLHVLYEGSSLVQGQNLLLKGQKIGSVKLRVAFDGSLSSPAGAADDDNPGQQEAAENQRVAVVENARRLLAFLAEFAARGDCWVQQMLGSWELGRPQCAAYVTVRGLSIPYTPFLVNMPLSSAPYNLREQWEDLEVFIRVYDLVATAVDRFGNANGRPREGTALGNDDLHPTEAISGAEAAELDDSRLAAWAAEAEEAARWAYDACCDGRVTGAIELLAKLVDDMVADGRCLFMLKSGRIGLGPTDMAVGDDVFNLYGVPAPMVLRRAAAAAGGVGVEERAVTTGEAMGGSAVVGAAIVAEGSNRGGGPTNSSGEENTGSATTSTTSENGVVYTVVGAAFVHGRMHGENDGPTVRDNEGKETPKLDDIVLI